MTGFVVQGHIYIYMRSDMIEISTKHLELQRENAESNGMKHHF